MTDIILPYKTIELGFGKVALVDELDFNSLIIHKWYALRQLRKSGEYIWYAIRRAANGSGNVRMHRQILGFPKGLDVDHRDGDGLHNWRLNLRAATRSQNLRNRHRGAAGKSSRFIGVSRFRDSTRWLATIRGGEIGPDGRSKKLHLGYFGTEEEAARAYDSAARRYFGEFASPNFP